MTRRARLLFDPRLRASLQKRKAPFDRGARPDGDLAVMNRRTGLRRGV
ncbi:MAG TPA: hypothetical protein VEL79_16555 [Vicinamibacterales bacterium]|nr:hypothetical protein [Vicinamibacterales bacterium]